MSKFGDDVEMKFGMAIDSTLEKKVKITILATGFALNNVPGMEDEVTKRRQDDEEQALLNRIRREDFYKNGNNPIEIKRPHNLYVFSDDDLTNDDVISMVEDIPAYKRTKDQLENIKRKSAVKDVASEIAEKDAEDEEASMILFNNI